MSFWLMCCRSQPGLQWEWNPLSTALSPLSPQEKMEIAKIEPTKSIPLFRKELKGTLATTERDRWREEWAIARVCQASCAPADTQPSDSSAIVSERSLSCSHRLSSCFSVFPTYTHSSSMSLVLTISLSPPLGCHFAAYGSPTQVLVRALRHAFVHTSAFVLFLYIFCC